MLLETHDSVSFAREGLLVALGMFVASVVESFAVEHQKYNSFCTGIVLQVFMVSAVYRHILVLFL